MRRLRSFIAILCILIAVPAIAQIEDVPAAFDQIGTTPEVLHLANTIKVPAGGHLQGIQALNDSLMIITGSSGDYAYYLVADHRRVRNIQKISDAPFRHAGGCQIAGHTLLVGTEDNIAKDRSDIYSITLSDAGQETDKAIVASRQGTYKRSTAGATAYAVANGGWLAGVADWDSRNIDLYTSVGDSLVILSTVTAPDSLHWCAYQSVNFVMDKASRLYVVGFAQDGGRNRADLFLFRIENTQSQLIPLRTRYFKCKGAGFRYAAGIRTTAAGRLQIYTSARNPASVIAINIFR